MVSTGNRYCHHIHGASKSSLGSGILAAPAARAFSSTTMIPAVPFVVAADPAETNMLPRTRVIVGDVRFLISEFDTTTSRFVAPLAKVFGAARAAPPQILGRLVPRRPAHLGTLPLAIGSPPSHEVLNRVNMPCQYPMLKVASNLKCSLTCKYENQPTMGFGCPPQQRGSHT